MIPPSGRALAPAPIAAAALVVARRGGSVFARGLATLCLVPFLGLGLGLGSVAVAGAADIVAHRGASHDAPENTVAAARLGWEQGADAVELDVHLSKDGRIVVIHDPDTRRTTGVAGRVVEQSWEELRRLDAGSWKDARFAGERLPTLEEMAAIVPAGRRLFIEIKCGPEILPELERVLRTTALRPEQIVIIGFGYDTMVQAKKRFPQFKVHWLSAFKREAKTGQMTPSIDSLIRRARTGGLSGLDLQYQGPIDADAVRRVKAAGLEFHVWTVDDAAEARRLSEAGVDSITTNRPRWLRDQLARPAASPAGDAAASPSTSGGSIPAPRL